MRRRGIKGEEKERDAVEGVKLKLRSFMCYQLRKISRYHKAGSVSKRHLQFFVGLPSIRGSYPVDAAGRVLSREQSRVFTHFLKSPQLIAACKRK